MRWTSLGAVAAGALAFAAAPAHAQPARIVYSGYVSATDNGYGPLPGGLTVNTGDFVSGSFDIDYAVPDADGSPSQGSYSFGGPGAFTYRVNNRTIAATQRGLGITDGPQDTLLLNAGAPITLDGVPVTNPGGFVFMQAQLTDGSGQLVAGDALPLTLGVPANPAATLYAAFSIGTSGTGGTTSSGFTFRFTTLTVVPAPASGACLAACAALAGRRRRPLARQAGRCR